MNKIPPHPLRTATRYLAVCFAVLSAVTVSLGATSDNDLKRLQQENEALRKQNAELQQRFAEMEARLNQASAEKSANQQPAMAQSSGRESSTAQSTLEKSSDSDVMVLSAFEVSGEKDNGYLKTNAATATRIGMEIQKVPMNVSVVSREFLDDTNTNSLMDMLRYTT